MNLNSGFYKDLDTNFEEAFKMSGMEFSHEELLEMLKNGNIPQKQLAAMRLEGIHNQSDADILVSNLTGCDGKIREAAALKISNLLRDKPECIKFFNQTETFANATIDINANICRLVIDFVPYLKQNQNFTKVYLDKILGFIFNAFEELDKIAFRDKKYVINKQLFKLYWCLVALKHFVDDIETETLFKILERTSCEKEYTIREKTAQIVVLTPFEELKRQLKNDENYYVRAVFGK